MDADSCQTFGFCNDERVEQLVHTARKLGATHPLLAQWPHEDGNSARSAALLAMLCDPEAGYRDRIAALRLIHNRVARFSEDFDEPEQLAAELQRLISDRINSIELMYGVVHFQYLLLGCRLRSSCSTRQNRVVFGLYRDRVSVPAGAEIPPISLMLKAAYRYISGMGRVNLRALDLSERKMAAELLLSYFLYGAGEQRRWRCPERLRALKQQGEPVWQTLKEDAPDMTADEAAYGLSNTLCIEVLELVRFLLESQDSGSITRAPKSAENEGAPRRLTESVRQVNCLTVIPGPIPPASDSGDQQQIKRFKPLQSQLPIMQLPDPEGLLAIQAALVAEFPWARNAIESILGELRLKRLLGAVDCRIRPTLIAGQPGVGKNRFARRLAEELGLTFRVVGIGGMDDSRTLLGTARGWSSGQPSPFLDLLLTAHSPSALVLLDEVDKATDKSSNSPSVAGALLGLLETESARVWFDHFLQTECDLSMMSFILTANSLANLPKALLSRCQIVMFSEPSAEHIAAAVPHALADLAQEWRLPPDVFKGFEPKARHLQARSMRELKSQLTSILMAEMVPPRGALWRH